MYTNVHNMFYSYIWATILFILLKQNKKIFKTDDLALLWGITNRNTLLTTIKRYLKKEILYSIRKGVYSVIQPDKLNPCLLGTAYVTGFCYVSLQTVLSQENLINQEPNAIMLIGNRTLNFNIGNNQYICRKMKSKLLHNLVGIDLNQEFPIATIERAIVDILYYNPNFYFDKDISKYQNKIKLIQKELLTWKLHTKKT